MSFRWLSGAIVPRTSRSRARARNLVVLAILSLILSACINTNVEDRADAVGKGRPGTAGTGGDAALAAFRDQFWTKIRSESCVGCHGAGQAPQFAHAEVNTAYAASAAYINLNAPGMSRVVTYPASGHNPCAPDAAGCAAKIQTWIEDMQRDIADN